MKTVPVKNTIFQIEYEIGTISEERKNALCMKKSYARAEKHPIEKPREAVKIQRQY